MMKRRNVGAAWIGFTDAKREGHFIWTNPFYRHNKYTHWHKGEPNDSGHNEDCTSIIKGWNGEWNDANCNGKLPFVCEIPRRRRHHVRVHHIRIHHHRHHYHLHRGHSRRIQVCERKAKTIHCNHGHIRITRALYGRTSSHICPHGSGVRKTRSCRARGAVSKVRHNCNNKKRCTLRASNGVFGDPCGGIFKYLDVTYQCVGGSHHGHITHHHIHPSRHHPRHHHGHHHRHPHRRHHRRHFRRHHGRHHGRHHRHHFRRHFRHHRRRRHRHRRRKHHRGRRDEIEVGLAEN